MTRKCLPALVLFFLCFFSLNLKAQDYKNAIGVRLGTYTGVNFKTFLNADDALDFNLSFRTHNGYKDVRLTGLYQIHAPIEDVPGLRWYYGFGASIGSQKYQDDSGLFFSIDGVAGLDYKFGGAPINLALDWRPRLELSPDANVTASDIGLAVRFTF
ncbi:hypothetical protein GS399_08260 [Pedobacter sp. HMF7647]|uniref:Outer membrane beta-barrel protein n=1 Tax=Hufsiella arboris TaxID=2695275 RepID=A0A7K1Y8N6_9SPHI|nr:hypothetical protein [Hufsiella arboris]MXV50963.1 hypothetical protein [Hufsiella arboris]